TSTIESPIMTRIDSARIEPTSRRRFLGAAAGAMFAGASGSLFAQAPAFRAPVASPGNAPAGPGIVPFRAAIPQAALDDLKRRLRDVRFPDKETVSDWSQGVPLAKAQALVAYWRDHYDWRRFEARLNAFPQFRTEIDGLGIHFIHVKSRHA